MRLAHLAGVRQAGYRLFSAAFLYPDEDRLDALAAVALELQGLSRALATFPFFPRWSRFLRALAACRDMPPAHLQESYVRLFLVSSDGLCPPCASHYLAPGAPARVMAEVESEYARAGLSVATGFDEPPDHAAVEFEFMGLLCAEEANAWSHRRPGDAVRRLTHGVAFLDEHLCRWFPEFSARVAAQDARGFYALAVEAAQAFIIHDLDLTRALLARHREVARA